MRIARNLAAALLAAALVCSGPALAHDRAVSQASVEDVQPAAAEAAAAVDAFHAALENGDTGAALALLADDVLILEGGSAERSKAEYAASHLAADAEFSAAVPNVRTHRTVRAVGDSAWVASEGRTQGQFNGRPINSLSAETIVLQRDAAGWRITHIHWSSQPVR